MHSNKKVQLQNVFVYTKLNETFQVNSFPKLKSSFDYRFRTKHVKSSKRMMDFKTSFSPKILSFCTDIYKNLVTNVKFSIKMP